MNRLTALASGIAFAGFLTLAPAHAQMNHGTMNMDGMGDTSMAYADAMKKMDMDMSAMMMTGKPGADFAAMMIPHHQGAIDMAKAYLASGENDPELTKLANDIVTAQESEIAFFKAWLAKNGQ